MKKHFTHKKRIVFPAILVALTLLGAWLLTIPAGAQTTNCPDISIFPCETVKLLPDQIFEFDGTEGGIPDANGVGTGFTMVDPPSSPGNPTPALGAPGYWPENLLVSNGALLVTSTPGLMSGSSNSQDNALGIGLDLGGPIAIETTIVNLPPAPGGFTQAGIWFGMSAIGPSGRGGTGTSEENYIKLALISPQANVWEVQGLMEIEGESVNSTTDPVLPNQPITLRLELNPSLATVQARYCNQADCDASAAPIFQAFPTVPSEWFSADAAGIDFTVGTRSMGGIFTTHRRAEAPVEFTFERFAYTTSTISALATSQDGVDFETWSFGPIAKPTAMDFGPDGRLYISDVTGFIHAVTLDYENRTLAEETIIDAVQMRLMLGLTIDPDSTPDNVILWVAHSDLDQFEGEANSGIITRLSGPGFAEREDVITGLPRAIANHATNNIHFGPDGRLYIAQGGNTGGGAANAGGSEFGPRPEQPLSAGILAADVKAPGFDGTCASEIDPDGAQMDATGIAAQDIPCDVEVYASGMRNPYDLYFHTNGEMYATDNGLGVVGTFPDLEPSFLDWDPASACEGLVEDIQAHFPGERPDLLHRVHEGAYYGHPNPSRTECVFFGGNPTDEADFPIPTTSDDTDDQFYLETDLYPVGMQPDPRLRLPIFNFGENKSANGIIEYSPEAPAFCGRLGGDLLVSYFSQSDQIQRLKLSPDGSRVVWDKALIRSSAGTGGKTLSNPLPITQDPAGRIYVGEFGYDQVTVFEPVNIGYWTSFGLTNQPTALLDAGGAALDGKLYVVGGKSESGHQSSLYAYHPISNTWQTLASLPIEYPGVENLAVAPYNGQLYAFGGSTEAFAGAVNKAAVYDPATDAWTMLPDMPTARGGVTAQTLGDEIYVIGGLGENGDSLATVEIFTPATGAWRAGDNLLTPRDNPGSAVFDGKLYIIGGRTIIGGDNVEPTLNTIEIFTPGVGWETGTPMPSGRRTMSVVVLNDEIIVMGGEKTPEGGAFQVTEAYDPVNDRWRLLTLMPVGRHGAVAGVIGNTAYIAGGGAEGGTSFSADIDAFYFDCNAVVPTSVRFAEPSIIGAPTSMSQLVAFLKSGFGFTDAGAEAIRLSTFASINLDTE